MIFKGIRIKVSCSNWEQIKILGEFWDEITSKIDINKLVGVGFGWDRDCFDYAIGLIDSFDELEIIKNFNIDDSEYIEMNLPDIGWETRTGKISDIQRIYEEEFDCYNIKFKYEIERFDDKGNCKISVLI